LFGFEGDDIASLKDLRPTYPSPSHFAGRRTTLRICATKFQASLLIVQRAAIFCAEVPMG
jgi:hypothetical protein